MGVPVRLTQEDQGSDFRFALPAYTEHRELTWALKAVNQQARATNRVTAVFFCQIVANPNPEPPKPKTGNPKPEIQNPSVSLDWGLTLNRVAEIIRPQTDETGVLRVLTERTALILICALPPEQAHEHYAKLLLTIHKAQLRDIAIAYQICPDPLPDIRTLLDNLAGRMSPIVEIPT